MRLRILVTLLVASSLVRAPGNLAHAQAAASEEADAKRAYADGAAAYRLGQFEEAIKHFEVAYRVLKNSSILFSIAQSYRRLFSDSKNLDAEKLGKAIGMYEAYLSFPDTENEKRKVASQLLPSLRKTYADLIKQERDRLIASAKGRDALDLSDRLLTQGATADALAVVERVLTTPNNSRDLIGAAYEKRGLLAARMHNDELAKASFGRALELDPGFILPSSADREAQESYAKAKELANGREPLSISQVALGTVVGNQHATIPVKIDSDPLAMIDHFGLYYRAAGTRAYSRVRVAHTAHELEVPQLFVLGLPSGTHVEYYVVGEDRADGALTELGSAVEPFSFTVETTLGSSGGTVEHKRSRTWVWIVVAAGVIVAGAAVGTGVYFATRGSSATTVHIPTQ